MSTIGASLVSGSLPLPQSAGSTHLSAGSRGNQSAAKAAQEFEGVFASMLLKEMRQTLEPGSLFGGEDSGDVYGGLFDRFFGEQMTQGSGLGMSRMLRDSIERLQQAGNPASSPARGTGPDAGPAAVGGNIHSITG
jgi:flagellar protein FlgJ